MSYFKTKHKEGYTTEEIAELIRLLDLDGNMFYDKLGINTVMEIDNETITYHCDVDLAVKCCLENKDRTTFEFD